MKKIYLFLFLTIGILTGCLKDDNRDREKVVTMVIHPEIGYGGAILSETYTEILLFSDGDDNSIQYLENIITEGFDFDYERGYQYTFKAKKIWMSTPPQDVSSIRYVFIGPINKERVITKDKEEIINLTVQPHLVKFHPKFSEESENGEYKVYNALLCRDDAAGSTVVLKSIEGFNYEEGYKYTLRVKRNISASPYSEKLDLLEILSKEKI